MDFCSLNELSHKATRSGKNANNCHQINKEVVVKHPLMWKTSIRIRGNAGHFSMSCFIICPIGSVYGIYLPTFGDDVYRKCR